MFRSQDTGPTKLRGAEPLRAHIAMHDASPMKMCKGTQHLVCEGTQHLAWTKTLNINWNQCNLHHGLCQHKAGICCTQQKDKNMDT